MSTTDNADPRTVLEQVRAEVRQHEPDVRLIGDVRAGDIVRALAVAIPLLPKSQSTRCPWTQDMFGGGA